MTTPQTALQERPRPRHDLRDERPSATCDVIHEPRPLPEGVAGYLRDACDGEAFDIEFDVCSGEPDVAALLSAMPERGEKSWLARDVREQLARFAARIGGRPYRVGFERITSDKCRKFHVDQVELRLLITYAGPGTEWVEEEDARRDQLGLRLHCHVEANAAVVPDERKIRRASPGDVLLLKGARWPGNERRGAIHRSPPIAAAGQRRLLLVATLFPG